MELLALLIERTGQHYCISLGLPWDCDVVYCSVKIFFFDYYQRG